MNNNYITDYDFLSKEAEKKVSGIDTIKTPFADSYYRSFSKIEYKIVKGLEDSAEAYYSTADFVVD